MSRLQHFDIVVIGSGITGRSTLFHLRQQGIHNVALAEDTRQKPSSEHAAGLVLGGQVDNFTRFSHAHGPAIAAALWQYGREALASLESFCGKQVVPFTRARRLRLITSDSELQEARQAVAELQALGFGGRLTSPASTCLGLTARTRAVQEEDDQAAFVDTAGLLRALSTEAARLGAVQDVSDRPGGLKLSLQDGNEVTCEIAVIAAHLAIGALIPSLREALVSVADQWHAASLDRLSTCVGAAPFVFSANHTYEWGGVMADGRVILGGGRYLRPLAGIEAAVARFEDRIQGHLQEQFRKTFGVAPVAGHGGASQAFLDCRPCDELPIIGPMFGQGRLLVATGYMGNGVGMGFYSGACLAELIAHGSAPSLPRCLWPERLRTMGN